MRGGDEDRASGVSSLANEEPLVVVKTCVDIVWEVVRENCGDGRGSVVWKGKASLRCGGSGSVCERAFSAEDGDIGRGWGGGSHRGSEVLASGRGDEHVVGIDGDVLMKRGKEESVEYFLSDLGGSGRHRRRGKAIDVVLFIMLFARVFFGACSDGFHRSLQSGLERTSPTLEPKSLPTRENLSTVQGIEGFGVFHGSGT